MQCILQYALYFLIGKVFILKRAREGEQHDDPFPKRQSLVVILSMEFCVSETPKLNGITVQQRSENVSAAVSFPAAFTCSFYVLLDINSQEFVCCQADTNQP